MGNTTVKGQEQRKASKQSETKELAFTLIHTHTHTHTPMLKWILNKSVFNMFLDENRW